MSLLFAYFTEPELLMLAGSAIGAARLITYFAMPVLLWLASTIIGEIADHNTFQSAGKSTVIAKILLQMHNKKIFYLENKDKNDGAQYKQ